MKCDTGEGEHAATVATVGQCPTCSTRHFKGAGLSTAIRFALLLRAGIAGTGAAEWQLDFVCASVLGCCHVLLLLPQLLHVQCSVRLAP